MNLHPGDPVFSRVRDLIQRHHQSVSMKVNLPLIELEAAKEDLNRFLQERLHELGSGGTGGDHSGPGQLQSYGLRGPPHSTDGATMSDQQDLVGPICGTTYGGCSSAWNPGWVVWEARHDASRCGGPAHLS